MLIEAMPVGFGAEVADFDPSRATDAGDVAALRAAYDTHHLLVLRGCGRLTPKRQVEIAGWFGTIGANSGSDGNPWTVLRNDEPSGSAALPFHSDITFMEFPLEGISLHPLALPDVETSTTFVSNAVAWDALSADTQALLADRTARHYYDAGHTMAFDWPVFEHWHPIRMAHRRTGRPLLFVTEHHVERIEGMNEAEGAALLERLFATLYAPARRYEHVWAEGDLLIWDNLAIQHARTRPSEPSEGARILQRVALGEHGFLDQLEAARRTVAA